MGVEQAEHGGRVLSFLAGKRELADVDAAATAVREFCEESGMLWGATWAKLAEAALRLPPPLPPSPGGTGATAPLDDLATRLAALRPFAAADAVVCVWARASKMALFLIEDKDFLPSAEAASSGAAASVPGNAEALVDIVAQHEAAFAERAQHSVARAQKPPRRPRPLTPNVDVMQALHWISVRALLSLPCPGPGLLPPPPPCLLPPFGPGPGPRGRCLRLRPFAFELLRDGQQQVRGALERLLRSSQQDFAGSASA